MSGRGSKTPVFWLLLAGINLATTPVFRLLDLLDLFDLSPYFEPAYRFMQIWIRDVVHGWIVGALAMLGLNVPWPSWATTLWIACVATVRGVDVMLARTETEVTATAAFAERLGLPPRRRVYALLYLLAPVVVVFMVLAAIRRPALWRTIAIGFGVALGAGMMILAIVAAAIRLSE